MIHITIQNANGELLKKFSAQKGKSILQAAKEESFHIPSSCKLGMCEMCKVKVISGHKLIQFDKISMPLKPLPQDETGNISHIFTCTAGIRDKYFQEDEDFEIILEKNI